MSPPPRSGGPPASLSRERSAAAYRADAVLLAAIVALALAITFAPYIFAAKSLLSSAAEVPSLYVSGARYDTAPPQLRSLDPAAAGFQTEPWLAIQNRIVVGEHRMPFWDPYDGYGLPFDAAMQPQPFYPLTAALALHPSPRTFTWFILARLFIAGWFAALFLRLFTDRVAAATGGVATAMTGYYLLYYGVPHLSVDTGLPMLLWASELVVRRPTAPRCAALAAAAGLTYLGGMPETALLSLVIATVYALVRLGSVDYGVLRGAGAIIAGHAVGMLVGAIALVPFAEFVRMSFNVHEASNVGGTVAGHAIDAAWRHGVLTELAPLAFGYPWSSILNAGTSHSGVRGFFGCAELLLALVALAALRRRSERTPIVIFFLGVALFCVLKRYGNPLVEWSGGLPLFSLIHFPKYVEYCLGDSVAILAGFGVAALRERAVSPRALGVAFAAALALLSYLFVAVRGDVPAGPDAWRFDAALLVALGALVAGGAAAYALLRDQAGRIASVASVAVPALIVAEIFTGYSAQQLWRNAPPLDANPYGGAPFVSFLQRHVDRPNERIFGIFGILFPNWPGAYGFADPRSLNALHPKDYLRFIDRFVASRPPTADDQFDRFTATRPLQLSAPLIRRWMALSSVGWLLSPSSIDSVEPPPGAFLSDLWAQVGPAIPSELQPAIHTGSAEIDGVPEDMLFEHPPNDVRFLTIVPAERPFVVADIGLEPATYTGAHVCGGPVTFTLTAQSAGRAVSAATRTIDPKHRAGDRHWIPLRLDLARWAKRPVTLVFTTAAQDTCAAYAVWGEPRFAERRDTPPLRNARLFRLAFESPGAFVYRVPGALPRMMLYHRARTIPVATQALDALAEPAFDPRREAIVERTVPLAAARGPERAVVTSQRSDEVVVDVDASSDALLMQNDTFFPGWEASVDMRPVTILRTDFLFRGVPVSAGHHTVRIAYRSRADTIGTLATLAGLFVILALFVAPRIRRKISRAAG